MPTINVQPRDMQDGTRITYFTDTVGTSSTTYTFNATQETIWLRNKGSKDITYTAGSFTGTLGKSEIVKLIGTFSSVILSSVQGTQAFELMSDEIGTVGSSPEAVSSLGQQVSALGSALAGFVKSINGTTPDANGNITIATSGGSGGSGSLTFNTLSDLQTAYPNGTTQPVWIVADNSWYYWSGAITPTVPPSDVTGLSVSSLSTTTLTLSWTASSGATSYDLYNGATLLGNTASTTFNVSGLTASTTYTFKVIAKNSVGSSSGVTTTATTTATTPTDTIAPVLTITPATTFTNTQTVTMSATDSSAFTIWYTVDGTDPTISGTKIQYSSPVTLAATTTVKAYAMDSASNASVVQTVTYTLNTISYTVKDTFTRADSTTSLGTSDTGQAWTPLIGTWGISSNNAYLTASATDAAAVIDSGKSDIDLSITLSTYTNCRVIFRCTDNSNYWLVQAGGTAYQLYKKVGGSFSSAGTFTKTNTNGDVVNVVTSGTSITVKVNGSQIITVTDSFNQTATKIGIGTASGTTSRFDNLMVV